MDIIEEIKLEIKNKFDIEISEDEIEAIVQSQSRTTRWAIEQGEDVMWIYFGKFKVKPGRLGALKKDEEVRKNLLIPNVIKNKQIKRIGIGVKIESVNKYGEGEQIIKIDNGTV